MTTGDDGTGSIEIVQGFLAALGKDFSGMRNAFSTRMSDDCEWENLGWPAFHGKETILATLDQMHQVLGLDHVDMRIRHILAAEDLVLTEQIEANFDSEGEPIGAPAAAMSAWTVRDGLITAWRDYFNPAEFLALVAEAAPS